MSYIYTLKVLRERKTYEASLIIIIIVYFVILYYDFKIIIFHYKRSL